LVDPTPRTVPVALTIAGSDPSGGAGIQADLRTFSELGVYGLSVVTALTAQDGSRIHGVERVADGWVAEQLESALRSGTPRAVKIGMVGSAAAVRAVVEGLGDVPSDVPVVLDPILAASDGSALLDESGRRALIDQLAARVSLLTPNLPEAATLTGLSAEEGHGVEWLGKQLAGLGPSVLIKGGHGSGPTVIDTLFHQGAVRRFEHARVSGSPPHGTGCVLSAAIAAYLAQGTDLEAAVERGIGYLVQRLRHPIDLEHGAYVLGESGGSSSSA